MTTTTKIFVILVCLFAFIFTPLAISFAARTDNWRKAATDYYNELAVAYANERSVMSIAASEIERYKDLRDQEQQRYITLKQDFDKLSQDYKTQSTQYEQMARSRDTWETSASLLTHEMKVKTEHNQELSSAKEQALERERELQARNLQLTDRVKELGAQVVVLSQQLDQKVEELVAYREENRQLRDQTGLGSAAAPLSVSPTPTAEAAGPAGQGPIVGQVVRVEGNLATIDVGSAAGVKPGTRMVVLREGQWVCDLEITEQITPTEAVGEIKLKAEDKRIRSGDSVEDVSSFTRS